LTANNLDLVTANGVMTWSLLDFKIYDVYTTLKGSDFRALSKIQNVVFCSFFYGKIHKF